METSGTSGGGFFHFLEAMIDSMTKEITNTANSSGVIKTLALIVGVTITLEIIITGLKVYAGKTETPTKDLIWSITLKMILVSIALDHGQYLSFIISAIKEIQKVMSGSESMFIVMDQKTNQTVALTKALGEISLGWREVGAQFSRIISYILIWAGYFLGMFSSFLLLVTTKLTLDILMLVAPLVIFLKAYSFGKDIFEQWLGAILTNFITIFILGSVFNMFSRRYDVFIEITTKEVSSGDFLLIGVHALLIGIILNMVVKVATNVAEQIGKVSLEGAGVGKAMGGAIAGGGAGAVAKVVGGAIGSAAVGAAKQGAKSAFGKK